MEEGLIKEFEDIVSGWKNLIVKNSGTEEVAKERLKICLQCKPHYKAAIKTCNVCNCFIPAAVRAANKKCLINKW